MSGDDLNRMNAAIVEIRSDLNWKTRIALTVAALFGVNEINNLVGLINTGPRSALIQSKDQLDLELKQIRSEHETFVENRNKEIERIKRDFVSHSYRSRYFCFVTDEFNRISRDEGTLPRHITYMSPIQWQARSDQQSKKAAAFIAAGGNRHEATHATVWDDVSIPPPEDGHEWRIFGSLAGISVPTNTVFPNQTDSTVRMGELISAWLVTRDPETKKDRIGIHTNLRGQFSICAKFEMYQVKK
jgi:hypothetical protein